MGATIEKLSTSGVKRFFNHFKLKALQADFAAEKITHEEMKRMQDADMAELRAISNTLGEENASEIFQKAETIVSDFYEKQKEKWTKSEHTKEDIERYFSEENLASLSFEDYALLLKRFPGEMVAYVTRQGIRDHIGMMYHTAGAGAYTNGFMKMIADGRLRSPLGVCLIEEEKEKAVAKFLRLEEFKSEEEALDYLDTLITTTQGEGGSYTDRMAVHFATEEVADHYYGSEKGNEIFIAYPSAYIASQYHFSGQLNESGGGYWNDQWVWANEEHGMDLNAGLVFIPEEARVNPKNGSRYELDKNMSPTENSEHQKQFMEVAKAPDFLEFAKSAMETPGEERWERFHEKLEKEFDITDQRLQRAILDYDGLFSLMVVHENPNEIVVGGITAREEKINKQLRDFGILYKEAKDAVSSKDFWESYFAENPTKRPSKIVYYKGADPTNALQEWKKMKGINKKTGDKNIGFSARNIERNAPQAVAGLDRFRVLAEKIIDDYFPAEQETIAA